jgi:mono/diheme cytochrome c family protein
MLFSMRRSILLFAKSIGVVLAGMLLAAISGMPFTGQAGAASQEKTGKTHKRVPIRHSESESGPQLWKDYCAACHGAAGAGDGPAAYILESPPADLSLMAKRNNGKFPADHFVSVLRFGSGGPIHGTSDMPFWGPLFRSLDSPPQENKVQLRIRNLSKFVESLQQK